MHPFNESGTSPPRYHRGRITRREGPLEQRFWAQIKKTRRCWLWQGTKINEGYGSIGAGGGAGSKLLVHRLSWILHNGPIPAGLCVLHRCDVRNCVRPDHLFLGTRTDNMRDMVKKGRHCPGSNGAKLTEFEVLAIRELYATGRYTQRDLAHRYNVDRRTIGRIIGHETWQHVGGAA